jgi:uncharacterized protein (UPF0276 family)
MNYLMSFFNSSLWTARLQPFVVTNIWYYTNIQHNIQIQHFIRAGLQFLVAYKIKLTNESYQISLSLTGIIFQILYTWINDAQAITSVDIINIYINNQNFKQKRQKYLLVVVVVLVLLINLI